MRIIDISMTLSPDMVVYEGDPKVSIRRVKNFPKDNVILSQITMGLHSGTHVDAPAHFIRKGGSVDKIPLGFLIGKARVCNLTRVKGSIGEADLKRCGVRRGEIILIKTKNSRLLGKKNFSRNFVALSEEAAEYLIQNRIKAVGIDYLSIERFRSKGHRVHKKLLSKKVPIIEGLSLKNVKPGIYTLFCLPLRIVGTEAAPARCILIG